MLLAGSALAQQMADPMRPPAAGATATPGQNAAPAVQMIMIAPERRYALIDGYAVAQGGRVRDAQVVRIEETQVTLRGHAGETTVLKLLPQAQKNAAGPSRLARSGAPEQDGKK